MAKTPALVGYFGGKNKFESFIKPYVPKNYKTYIEPFSGSFGVYFFLDMPNNTKVIFNDINKDQTNLVACSKEYEKFLKYLKDELYNIEGSLYCPETDEVKIKQHYKELYYSLKNSNFRNETFNIPDFKRASTYAFLLTSAFSSCSYTAAGFSGFKLKTFLNKLQNIQLQSKLSKIDVFETLNFEESILKYDSPETFIYLDPPYFSMNDVGDDTGKRAGWYGTKDEFGGEQHIKLLEMLPKLKSKWMLSYYYFPALDKYFPKDKYFWLEKEFFRSSASFSENKSVKGSELLILNYDPNLIVNYTETSEKLLDEIEKVNEGAFINSEKSDIVEKTVDNLVSNVKDIDPEFVDIVNKNFDELLNTNKEDDVDDFWLT
jgi:DNA adenine methylase